MYGKEQDTPPLKPLLGQTEDELIGVARGLNLPAYVGKQLAGWLYKHQVTDIAAMTNLSRDARTRLSQQFTVGASLPVGSQESADGTMKYLFRTQGGHYVETVFIPDGDRATLCVSSQVGCKMGCAFCMTGRQGYIASLSTADILNQIYSLPQRDRLTNIVFMGQGEPLDNVDNVLRALQVLTAPWGYAWSPRRITVSSVGVAKGLCRLLRESRCHVAISLHHPVPQERAKLMPAERATSITDIIKILESNGFGRHAAHDAGESHQRRLSFEYILLSGLNDSPRHAEALVRLLRGLNCRVNLIRFHEIPNSRFRAATEPSMLRFRDYLTSHGLFATLRASRGQDILAACGLLSTKRQEAERRDQAIAQPQVSCSS